MGIHEHSSNIFSGTSTITRALDDSSSDNRPRRIGIMGGTFDPIHYGHLVAASEVVSLYHLDEMVFVPTGTPWQKSERALPVSSAEDRYLMTVLATATNQQFSVSRVDIDRGGKTYTVDTLRDLKSIYPDAELFFITGIDALNTILSWQHWEELFELAEFVGVSRPGYIVHDKNFKHLPRKKISLVEVPGMAVSSTDCRERARTGRPIWYMVPDTVVRYITKRGLYQQRE